jgi:hypothetical protein
MNPLAGVGKGSLETQGADRCADRVLFTFACFFFNCLCAVPDIKPTGITLSCRRDQFALAIFSVAHDFFQELEGGVKRPLPKNWHYTPLFTLK